MATRIQKHWRGFRARVAIADQLRHECERMFTQCHSKPSSCQPLQLGSGTGPLGVFASAMWMLSPYTDTVSRLRNDDNNSNNNNNDNLGDSMDVDSSGQASSTNADITMNDDDNKSADDWEWQCVASLLKCTVGDGSSMAKDGNMLDIFGKGEGRLMDGLESLKEQQAIFNVRARSMLRICVRIVRSFPKHGRMNKMDRSNRNEGDCVQESLLRSLIGIRSLTDPRILPGGKSAAARLLYSEGSKGQYSSLGYELVSLLLNSFDIAQSSQQNLASPRREKDIFRLNDAEMIATTTVSESKSDNNQVSDAVRQAALNATALLGSRCVLLRGHSESSEKASNIVNDICDKIFGIRELSRRWRAIIGVGREFRYACYEALAERTSFIKCDQIKSTYEIERLVFMIGNISENGRDDIVGSLPREDNDAIADARHIATCITNLGYIIFVNSNERSRQSSEVYSNDEFPRQQVDDSVYTMRERNVNSVFKAISGQLYGLTDGQFLGRLISLLTSQEKNTMSDSTILGDFTYFCLFKLPDQEIRSKILSALAFRANFVEDLWKFVKKYLQLWNNGSSGSHVWTLPLIVCFCKVFGHQLIVVDDEDMYQLGRPLKLADMVEVITLMTPVLAKIFLEGKSLDGGGGVTPSSQTSSTFQNSKDETKTSDNSFSVWTVDKEIAENAAQSMSTLLSKLFDRNSRRHFIAPERFVVSVGDSRFVSDAVAMFEAMENDVISSNPESFRIELGTKSRPDAKTILQIAPFMIPFKDRVRILQSLIKDDLDKVVSSSYNRNMFHRPGVDVTIRRSHIVHDGWNGLGKLTSSELKFPIRIGFIDEFGLREAGIDGGGLFKDFLDSFIIKAYNPDGGLFLETQDRLLYPNPDSAKYVPDNLEIYSFLGRMLGKAVYEGILLELPFAGFFLTKLRGRTPGLHDLVTLDPELARSLRFLRRYDGDVEDLSIFFMVDDVELIPNGKDVPVTHENALHYTHLVANHRLNTSIRKQTAAFLSGFQELIRPSWLAMFNESEIQVLLSGYEGMVEGDGNATVIDIHDLQANVTYSAGYHDQHPTIRMLWRAVAEFSNDEQRKFLKFVTSCSRVPLLGFAALEPKMQIQRSGIPGIDAPDRDADITRLPTSGTCINLLKLPPYQV